MEYKDRDYMGTRTSRLDLNEGYIANRRPTLKKSGLEKAINAVKWGLLFGAVAAATYCVNDISKRPTGYLYQSK